MSVQNLVLGQLCRRRGYGYELIDRLEPVMEPLQFTPAAVYRALDALLGKGFIVEIARGEANERGTPRVWFDATDSGRDHFGSWMASEPRKLPLREELYMQLLSADESHVPQLLRLLDRYRSVCREGLRLAFAKIDELDPANPRISVFGSALVLDAQCSHFQAMLEWADGAQRTLENVAAATGEPGRTRP